MLGFMEKKLTNSGPFRKSADKHSIYTYRACPTHAWWSVQEQAVVVGERP